MQYFRVNLRFKKINMIVEVGKFFEERPWFKNKRRQCHLREIHSWTNLLQQTPHQTFVFVAHIFRLRAINQGTKLNLITFNNKTELSF